MSHARRLLPVLLAACSLASVAQAGGLVERLPAGAQVVGYLDLAAFRSSSAVAALDAGALGREFGLDAGLLTGFGDMGQFERVALGGFPATGGQEMQLALIVDGKWDQAALVKGLLDSGSVEIAVGGQPAYRMPKDENGDDFVVSFLDEGRLAVSDWDLAERVRAGGGSLSAELAREVSALPPSLSAWLLVADPLAAGAASGVRTGAAGGLAAGLRSLSVWARAKEDVEVGASALARDAQQATQLSGLLQFGLLALAGQGAGEWGDVLSTLRFDNSGDRLSLGFKLGPEQVARLAKGLEPATAAAAGAPPR